MSDNFRYAQLQPFSLAGGGAIVGATTITLKSMTDIDGNLVVFATVFGSKGFGTLEPGNGTSEEQISFSGVTQNSNGTATLTGVKSVTFTYPYTETSGLAKTHAGSTSFIISNTSGFYNEFPSKDDDETINGIWTFATGATPLIIDQPTTNTQAANKLYVDTVAIAGAPNASDVTKGITKLSVAAVAPTNPIAVGDNDTRVPTVGQAAALPGNNTDIAVGSGNKYVTQTGLQHNAEKWVADSSGSTTAYVATLSPAPTSQTDGMVVYVKIGSANTTTTPTLAVNGLTARTIVKTGGTALAVSDIAAGMYCTFQYDLTNTRWIMTNPVANAPALAANLTSTSGVSGGPATSSTQTITHGLGRIPTIIRLDAIGPTLGNASSASRGTSKGTYNTTGNRMVFNAGTTGGSSSNSQTSATQAIYCDTGDLNTNAYGVVGNVGATTFDIVWTLSGATVASANFLWEAQ